MTTVRMDHTTQDKDTRLTDQYFASCVFGWALKPTLQDAVNALVAHVEVDNKNIRRNQREGKPGFPIVYQKLRMPEDARFDIEFYQVKENPSVQVTGSGIGYITHVAKTGPVFWKQPEQTQTQK